ncbi:MAG: hypothetical protein HY329_15270 [Chloroflexi bacterium]|nr:hypothetical protein [Chloroflexota bacterium]
MPFKSKYLFIASMDVEPEKEALFNEVYDGEHVPYLGSVSGVGRIVRGEKQDLLAVPGVESMFKSAPDEPKYSAYYELDNPEILGSPAWLQAVNEGRWVDQVRPYTRNRRHLLMKIIYPSE